MKLRNDISTLYVIESWSFIYVTKVLHVGTSTHENEKKTLEKIISSMQEINFFFRVWEDAIAFCLLMMCGRIFWETKFIYLFEQMKWCEMRYLLSRRNERHKISECDFVCVRLNVAASISRTRNMTSVIHLLLNLIYGLWLIDIARFSPFCIFSVTLKRLVSLAMYHIWFSSCLSHPHLLNQLLSHMKLCWMRKSYVNCHSDTEELQRKQSDWCAKRQRIIINPTATISTILYIFFPRIFNYH